MQLVPSRLCNLWIDAKGHRAISAEVSNLWIINGGLATLPQEEPMVYASAINVKAHDIAR
jgi:hypothetical protein